jgi:CheY-like chemotaxis protein
VTTANLVLLCDDLLFASRVSGTARSLGIGLRTVKTTETLEAAIRQAPVDCIIVDLSNPGLSAAALMTRLKEICITMPRVVAFGSHVDTATLKAARDAGCNPVWPRSKFAEELETALPTWVTRST